MGKASGTVGTTELVGELATSGCQDAVTSDSGCSLRCQHCVVLLNGRGMTAAVCLEAEAGVFLHSCGCDRCRFPLLRNTRVLRYPVGLQERAASVQRANAHR